MEFHTCNLYGRRESGPTGSPTAVEHIPSWRLAVSMVHWAEGARNQQTH